MKLKDKIILLVHNEGVLIYSKIRKKYKSLPPMLIKSKKLRNQISYSKISRYPEEIQNDLKFAIQNQDSVETMFGVDKLAELFGLLLRTESFNGDIIELGTYKCGTTIMMARFLKNVQSSRRIYACDTFGIFPYKDDDSEESIKESFGKVINKMDLFKDNSYETVLKKIDVFGVVDIIKIVKGSFDDTLPKLKDEKFSFALVDCDIGPSTVVVLKNIWPRMVKGGIMMFDDYNSENDWGLKKVVDDFVKRNNLELHQDVQPYIIK